MCLGTYLGTKPWELLCSLFGAHHVDMHFLSLADCLLDILFYYVFQGFLSVGIRAEIPLV